MLCETYITELNVNKVHIDGYELHEKHGLSSSRGGVALYINNTLKFKIISDISYFEEGLYESCFIEISTTDISKSIVAGEIYRVPNTDETLFINKYEEITNIILEENKEMIIGTDQNLDFIKLN